MKKISMGIAVALATTLATPLVFADETPVVADEAQVATADAPAAPAAANAVRVVRDKRSGELRAPNASELEEMEAMDQATREADGVAARAVSEPVVVRSANGMLSAELGPEYLISLQGERKEDGSVEQTHATGDKDQSVDHDEDPTE